jgi:NADPH:quinone reductase-like Zn-dependent oxidoreductase
MQAIVQHRYGGPDSLQLEEIEPPEAGRDGIIIRVRAAALNPLDYFLTSGRLMLRPMSGVRRPKETRVGMDFAGVVEEVGPAVTRFAPGDAVYGSARGAFAEYMRSSEERALAPKPERLTFEQAAGIPIAGLTALQGLRDAAQLQPGQSIAITGAAGGVGSFAVQIAKAMGAEVTGVCRTENVEVVRSLGADHVVDYTQEDYTRGRTYDVILENGGGHSIRSLLRALTPNGVLIPNCGSDLSMIAGAYVSRYVLRRPVRNFLSRLRRPDDFAELNRLVDEGLHTPLVDRTYPLAEVGEALRYLAQRHARGKVVLTV